MKKYILPVALIACGIVVAVLAAIRVLPESVRIIWVLGLLLVGVGFQRFWIAHKSPDTKDNKPEPPVSVPQPAAPEMAAPASPPAAPEAIVAIPPPTVPEVSVTPPPMPPIEETVVEPPSPPDAPEIPTPEPAEPAAPQAVMSEPLAYTSIIFHLTGVTRGNADDESRQELIKKLHLHEPPFENSDTLDIQLQPSPGGEGEATIECRVNGHLIGFVPKDKLAIVADAMLKKGMTVSALNVLGGDNDHLVHGVEVVVRFEDDGCRGVSTLF